MLDSAQAALAALPDRVRLPLAFDPGPLAAELGRFDSEDWISHYVTDNYEGDWSVIPLRAPEGESHPLRQIFPHPGAERFVDTGFLDRAPALREAIGCFQCPLQTARLMRLAPGSRIKEHRDPGLDAASGCARLHVPIATGEEAEFLLDRRPVPMEPGSVWYLRLADPHSAVNRGSVDRVHLVIDATVNGWLAGMLRAGCG
ncbi:MAG TPA: aspartyl/asparaginyl beta-hydroxylase domain-containing protein [Allosphingosinicella sp.]|nr:aspartyl/asparaginyl beta-hydroxylase domain-containing protein [Allosphingosinicella sp.]